MAKSAADKIHSVARIALCNIRWDDPELQARAGINQETVDEYAELMAAQGFDEKSWPHLVVFSDEDGDGRFWPGDGWHRGAAAQQAGLKWWTCEIRLGTREDALWYALGANKSHGLRRSNADKRRAVELALKARPELSDRAIAEHCGVGNKFVGDLRRQVCSEHTCKDVTLCGGVPETHVETDGLAGDSGADEGDEEGAATGGAPVLRVGRDGKSYRVPAPAPAAPPAADPDRAAVLKEQADQEARWRAQRKEDVRILRERCKRIWQLEVPELPPDLGNDDYALLRNRAADGLNEDETWESHREVLRKDLERVARKYAREDAVAYAGRQAGKSGREIKYGIEAAAACAQGLRAAAGTVRRSVEVVHGLPLFDGLEQQALAHASGLEALAGSAGA